MSPSELESVLAEGESSSVEFKRCGGLPGDDVYETVCSFANRNGGSIFLGVLDDGSVEGVDGRRVVEVQRNLVNRVCNPNQFSPSPAVETEEVRLDGRTVVRVWVPMSASVVRFKGVAYDRMFDADRRVDTAGSVQVHDRWESGALVMNLNASTRRRETRPGFARARAHDVPRLPSVIAASDGMSGCACRPRRRPRLPAPAW